ncbi:Stp1/IreP family PP2C-type Ser/Thr phosphatase [Pseudalkalibacillus hwajinpoensis]|uniref:protein-serine/threonine phosphatase n=1 Tax=Guptibacillus hwajinpoensis TaxID=208199 RepID=A0A4U1MM40_9BACL|nr:Stp1/IreP family PP2C-type Ser/Thr phosphatase [Pseudalkalibacillus hwajinpoensis]TKD71705.1 Stp1/IreP family PP2C-type Ser/Thr phosphatase [Pseudalkalibacillus hwajinpoensis]
MQAVTLTDQGQVRAYNEDSTNAVQNSLGEYLVVVADGMGGHQAGDVASALAVESLQLSWEEEEAGFRPGRAEAWLLHTIQQANETILTLSKEKPQYAGMGTTLVAAVCTSEFITIAHVGDSRAYLIGNNALSQKTSDHSLVNELVKNGQLSEEEAEDHPRKNVLLRALGTDLNVKVDVHTFEWDEEEAALFCSDGLTNKLSDAQLEVVMNSDQLLEEKAAELIRLANEAGGEDNITVAIIENSSSSGSEV